MAELLMRINYALRLGSFDMDFDDGEVRFRTSIRISPKEATVGIVEHLIFSNIQVMDMTFPVLMEFTYGTKSAQELIDKFILDVSGND